MNKILLTAILFIFSVGSAYGALDDGLVAYYPFDGNANDESGNGNHGTEQGGVALTTDRFGTANSAYSFHGEGDHIQLPVLFNQSQDLLTIAAWVYFNPTQYCTFSSIYGEFISNNRDEGRNDFYFRQDGMLTFDHHPPSGGNARCDISNGLIGNWVHVAMVKNNTLINFFKNGQKVCSLSYTQSFSGNEPTIATIGERLVWSDYYCTDGKIDDVFIFNQALLDSEIFNIYYSESPNDTDEDGIVDSTDNCLNTPNGPDNGTCTAGDNIGDNCTDNGTCGIDGFCSMDQEDEDSDGTGDACDNCTDSDEDGYCAEDGVDCDDIDPTINPGANEVCDGIDNNCFGGIDEDLTISCGTGSCQGIQTCSGGVWGSCSISDGTPCDDGVACTESDLCSGGVCNGTPNNSNCSDGNVCTDDICIVGVGCSNPNNNDPCDDTVACTETDVCSGGTCNGTPNNSLCNDNNTCTDDICTVGVGCSYDNNTAPCDDGLFCTDNDTCGGGTCTGTATDCSGVEDQCNDGVCDEELNQCVVQPKNNGTVCDDGIFCNGDDTCSDGNCSVHAGDPCPPLVCIESFGACFSDNDADGIPDDGDNSTIPGDNPCVGGETELCDDNCPNTPNGPDLGTCVRIASGVLMGTGDNCTSYEDCEGDEYCQIEQGDINGNGAGDVCECYADFNDNARLDGGDMFLIVSEANASLRNCDPDSDTSPPCCYADANKNGRIDGGDMFIMVSEANASRRNCPIIPHCPNVP